MIRPAIGAFLAILLVARIARADGLSHPGGGGAPAGTASGDLCGTYPNPCVTDDSHSHGVESITSIPRFSSPPGSTLRGIPGAAVHGTITLALATGNTFYWPFTVHESIDVTEAAFEVTVAGSGGSTGLVAIYNRSSTFQPTSRVLDFGSVSIASTGVKTLSASGTLPPGDYFFGMRISANATLRLLYYVLPSAPNVSFAAGAPTTYVVYVAEAHGAMPATATAWDTKANSTAGSGWAGPIALTWTLTP